MITVMIIGDFHSAYYDQYGLARRYQWYEDLVMDDEPF